MPNGGGGYLVLTEPWPSMLRRHLGRRRALPGHVLVALRRACYFAGDGAKKDEDGDIWLLGRVDDVMNVSGHRISTTEVESALVSHPKVAEAAVVGATDATTGQGIVAFVILRGSVADERPATRSSKELRDHVAKEIGPIAKPRQILVVAGAAEDPVRQDHAPAAARRRREPASSATSPRWPTPRSWT